MILPEEEMPEVVIEDHGDIEVKGVGLDHLEGMEQWDRWDPLDQGDSQERMDHPPPGAHSLPQDWEYPLMFNANLSTIGMENSLHYLGESLNHVMQFQQNMKSKHGRTPKYDREKSVAPGSGFGSISGKYTTKGI